MKNKAEAIGLMLSAFPASDADAEASARAYLLSVEECSEEAVKRAAKEFLRGEVESHNKQFAPSAAEFAIRCRLHEKILTSAARRAKEKPEALATLSDDERKMVAARIAQLAKPAGGD